jgi:hypothetical protein
MLGRVRHRQRVQRRLSRLVAGDLAFKIDFRFWIVALKLISAKRFPILLRNLRDLVRGGRHGHAGGILSQ